MPKSADGSKSNEAAEIKRGNVKDDRLADKHRNFANKLTTGTTNTTIDAQARDWFKTLSAEERSGATRFSDRAFLGSLLALSTPWLTSTTTKSNATTVTNQTNDDNHVSRSGEYIFPCTFYVSIPGLSCNFDDRQTVFTTC